MLLLLILTRTNMCMFLSTFLPDSFTFNLNALDGNECLEKKDFLHEVTIEVIFQSISEYYYYTCGQEIIKKVCCFFFVSKKCIYVIF